MSPSPVDLSNLVHEAMQAVSVSLQLENADATIGVDYDWLNGHYKAAWVQGASVSDDDYAQVRSQLEAKLDADSGIIPTVALLMEPDYQEKGFVLFVLGAGLRRATGSPSRPRTGRGRTLAGSPHPRRVPRHVEVGPR